MRKILYILLLLGYGVLGQKNIQLITKNLSQFKIDEVLLFDLNQKEHIKFKYHDTLNFYIKNNEIYFYNLHYLQDGERKLNSQFILDPGKIKIETHLLESNILIDSVYNSPIYHSQLNFKQRYLEFHNSTDPYKSIVFNQYLLRLFSKNINNAFSLDIASNFIGLNQNSKADLVQLKKLIDIQGDKFKDHLLYPMVSERIVKLLENERIDLTEYEFVDRKNKNVKIGFNEKYTVLDFWFLACKPCISDHKEISSEIIKFKTKNVEMVSVSIDDYNNKWNEYLEKHGYSWPNYLEANPNKISKFLNISVFPTYLILDNSGKIAMTYNSFEEVKKWVSLQD